MSCGRSIQWLRAHNYLAWRCCVTARAHTRALVTRGLVHVRPYTQISRVRRWYSCGCIDCIDTNVSTLPRPREHPRVLSKNILCEERAEFSLSLSFSLSLPLSQNKINYVVLEILVDVWLDTEMLLVLVHELRNWLQKYLPDIIAFYSFFLSDFIAGNDKEGVLALVVIPQLADTMSPWDKTLSVRYRASSPLSLTCVPSQTCLRSVLKRICVHSAYLYTRSSLVLLLSFLREYIPFFFFPLLPAWDTLWIPPLVPLLTDVSVPISSLVIHEHSIVFFRNIFFRTRACAIRVRARKRLAESRLFTRDLRRMGNLLLSISNFPRLELDWRLRFNDTRESSEKGRVPAVA